MEKSLKLRLEQFRSDAADLSASVALGRDLLQTGHHNEAVEVAQAARQRHGPQGELSLLEGEAWLSAGQLLRAQAALIDAAKLSPKEVRSYRWLGEVLIRRGDAKRALKVLKKARQLAPHDSEVRHLYHRADRLLPADDDGRPDESHFDHKPTTMRLPEGSPEAAPMPPPASAFPAPPPAMDQPFSKGNGRKKQARSSVKASPVKGVSSPPRAQPPVKPPTDPPPVPSEPPRNKHASVRAAPPPKPVGAPRRTEGAPSDFRKKRTELGMAPSDPQPLADALEGPVRPEPQTGSSSLLQEVSEGSSSGMVPSAVPDQRRGKRKKKGGLPGRFRRGSTRSRGRRTWVLVLGVIVGFAAVGAGGYGAWLVYRRGAVAAELKQVDQQLARASHTQISTIAERLDTLSRDPVADVRAVRSRLLLVTAVDAIESGGASRGALGRALKSYRPGKGDKPFVRACRGLLFFFEGERRQALDVYRRFDPAGEASVRLPWLRYVLGRLGFFLGEASAARWLEGGIEKKMLLVALARSEVAVLEQDGANTDPLWTRWGGLRSNSIRVRLWSLWADPSRGSLSADFVKTVQSRGSVADRALMAVVLARSNDGAPLNDVSKGQLLNPAVATEVVQELMERGRVEAAAAMVERLIERQGPAAPWLLLRAWVLLHRGDWKGAESAVAGVKYPMAPTLRLEARLALEGGDMDVLRAVEARLADKGGGGLGAALLRSRVLLRLGRVKDSEAILSEVLKRGDVNADVWLAQGELALWKGALPKGVELLLQAVAKRPSPEVQRALGHAYRLMGDGEKAQERYRLAMTPRFDPGAFESLFGMAVRDGDLERVRSLLDGVTQGQGMAAAARSLVGLWAEYVNGEVGDTEKDADAFVKRAKAVLDGPVGANAIRALAVRVALTLGLVERAAALAEGLPKVALERWWVLFRVRTLTGLRRYDEALAVARDSEDRFSRDGAALELEALEARLGKKEYAFVRKRAEELLKNEGLSPLLRDRLLFARAKANLLDRIGDLDSALKTFRELAGRADKGRVIDPEVHYHHARALWEDARYADAKESLKVYLKYDPLGARAKEARGVLRRGRW